MKEDKKTVPGKQELKEFIIITTPIEDAKGHPLGSNKRTLDNNKKSCESMKLTCKGKYTDKYRLLQGCYSV